MELGEKIKRLRLRHGLTQEELALRCDLSKGFISQLERDLTSPSIATLMDILECLGTDLKTFFADEQEEKIVFGQQDIYDTKDLERGTVIAWLIPNAQKNEMEPILLELSPAGPRCWTTPTRGRSLATCFPAACKSSLATRRTRRKRAKASISAPKRPTASATPASNPRASCGFPPRPASRGGDAKRNGGSMP